MTGKRSVQRDLIHACIQGYELYTLAGRINDARRAKGINSSLKGVLFPLTNSVVEHREDRDVAALKRRINCTVGELKKLVEELWKLGCRKAASFIRDYANTLVTFAVRAVKGEECPGLEVHYHRAISG